MNDVPITELFSAYLDGELTAEEQAGVEHLLASDPAARQLLDEMRTLGITLQALPQQTIGEDLSQRVLNVAARRMLVGDGDRIHADSDSRETASGESKVALTRASSGQDDDLKPLWKELSWRGLFSRRALVWSGIAIALAIFFRWTEPPKPDGRAIVKITRKDDDHKKAAKLDDEAVNAPIKNAPLKDAPTKDQLAKTEGEVLEKRKWPEMSSADAPVDRPAPEAKAAGERNMAADENGAVAADRTLESRRSLLKSSRPQGQLPEEQTAQNDAAQKKPMQPQTDGTQNIRPNQAEQLAADKAFAPQVVGGPRGTLKRDKKATDERVLAVEKPLPAPMPDAPQAGATAAMPKTPAPAKALGGKRDSPDQVASASELSDAKRATTRASKMAGSKDEELTRKLGQDAAPMNNETLIVKLDLTRQAVNDRAFEQLLVQAGLAEQGQDAEKRLLQNGGLNLVRQGIANTAGFGIGGGANTFGGNVAQATAPTNAPNLNTMNGTNAVNSNAFYNNANFANNSQTDGNLTNSVSSNGITSNGIASNGIASNGTLSNFSSQNVSPENAVRPNGGSLPAPSQQMQNAQLPANNYDADNLKAGRYFGMAQGQGAIAAPLREIVKVDATASQVAALRKALSGNHPTFSCVCTSGDEERLGPDSGRTGKGAAMLKPGSVTLDFTAKPSGPAPVAASPQAASNLTHVVFELRVVDPSDNPLSAVTVSGGTADVTKSLPNTLQFSSSGGRSATGSSAYQNAPDSAPSAVPPPAPTAPNLPNKH